MAEQRRFGARVPECGVDLAARRRALENMPMCRIDGQVQAEEEAACDCARDIAGLLETQTHLLCDILAAVNGLAAAQLARGR